MALAQADAARRGCVAPAGGLSYSPDYGMYGVGFFEPGHDHGNGGLGNPWLYFNASDGAPAGADIPGVGSAGDILLQAQFPIHSGRIVEVTGRVIVSLVGLAVAALSVTGLLLWWRKRRARHKHAGREKNIAARAG